MANKPYYGTYNATLNLTHSGGTRTASTGGQYKEVVVKEIEVDDVDAFVSILSVNTDLSTGTKVIAADVYRDFNALLIENLSETAIELQYSTGSWSGSTPDTYGSALYLTTFVPAGDYTFIENPRILGYSSGVQSSMLGNVTNTTALDPTHISDTGVDLDASMTAAYDNTSVTVTDSDALAAGDLLVLSPFTDGAINESSGAHTFEIIRVKSVTSATTIEVERGLFGTTPCAHDHTDGDQEEIYFWGMNEHVEPAFLARNDYTVAASTATDTAGAMATLTTAAGNFIDAGFQPGMMLSFVPNGVAYNTRAGIITEVTATVITFHRWSASMVAFTNTSSHYAFAAGYWCGTDGQGRYKSNTFLGDNIRNASHINGLVPGAQSIDFPVPVEQRLGMKNLTSKTKSGLAASTQYEFYLNLDGQREHVAFTTDANNLNWGGSNGVLQKIQTVLADKVADGSLYRNVSVSMNGGDIVFKSHSGGGHWNGKVTNRATDGTNRTGASQIDLQDYSGGTQFLGSGNVPGSALPSTSNDFMPTEKLHPKTNEVYQDPSNKLIDRGNGVLKRSLGGSGSINYETGAIDLKGLPIWSQMHGYSIKGSAHSGQLDTDATASCNGIKQVKVRSVNSATNSLIRITILA